MMKLLIVDDEPAVLSALRRELRGLFAGSLQVETCDDPARALTLVRDQGFDIVISDLRMPEVDGLLFLSLVSAIAPNAIRMVLTGSADFETAQRAINDAGVFRYLTKPWSPTDLRCHVAAAMAVCEQARNPVRQAEPDAQERERLRLEALEPGITAVEWSEQGEVLMPPLGS